ncbi:hypothetical protein LCGC14_2946290 [marine sediment metagenome]|uniref:Uncharacterized protein n=1 Tax=marine sediment metagenome TaxID=412755 RepID=A0A0F8Y3M6_9ZZZZ
MIAVENIFPRAPRDPERITPMLAKVKELWEKVPQLRLGQLLGNCVRSEIQLYYMEDDVLLEKLEAMYSEADKD